MRFLGRRRREAELDEELQFHLEREYESNLAVGMSPEEAMRAARRDFGSLPATKDDCRDERRSRLLTESWADLRYACRGMRRSPAHVGAVILVLGLGLGATIGIFSLVHSVLIRPLGFHEPERIARLYAVRSSDDDIAPLLSAAEYSRLQNAGEVLSPVAAYSLGSGTLRGTDAPREVRIDYVTASMFTLLGVRPILGRAFQDGEAVGGAPVVVLSHQLWRTRFGHDSAIVGKAIRLDERSYQIVGVMPEGFRGPRLIPVDLWLPMVVDATSPGATPDRPREVMVYGRLRPGLSLAMAAQRLNAQGGGPHALEEAAAPTGRLSLESLRDLVVSDVQSPLFLLFGAVGLVLLLATASVAALLLAQGEGRRREIGVRLALGASRIRVLRQVLLDATLKAVLGGVLGLALATLIVRTLRHFAMGIVPRAEEIAVDTTAVVFAMIAALLVGLLAGSWPAVSAAAYRLTDAFGNGRPAVGGRNRRFHRMLVTLQVALSVVLLCGAGLTARSFLRMWPTDPGFATSNRLVMSLRLQDSTYRDPAARLRFQEGVVGQLEALPGVQGVGTVSFIPLVQISSLAVLIPEEAGGASNRPTATLHHRSVNPGYLGVMEIPILRGRPLAAADRLGSERVALLNQAAVEKYWRGEPPLGRTIRFVLGRDTAVARVVGVVGNLRFSGHDTRSRPEVYVPAAQSPSRSLNFVIHTGGTPTAIGPLARAAVALVDPRQPVQDLTTLASIGREAVAVPRFYLLVMGVFGILGLALATAGTYGLLACTVTARRAEIGIRLALGASPATIGRWIVTHGLVPVGIGLSVGLAGSLALTGLLRSLLFEISPTDPPVVVGVPLLLGLVALLAAWRPAAAAMRTDPAETLRSN
ncbi:MAG: ABC transporter permease [Gemmatimonadales bacterium]|nr:ABC transporter permease [Gemmatimonadales bacterium]